LLSFYKRQFNLVYFYWNFKTVNFLSKCPKKYRHWPILLFYSNFYEIWAIFLKLGFNPSAVLAIFSHQKLILRWWITRKVLFQLWNCTSPLKIQIKGMIDRGIIIQKWTHFILGKFKVNMLDYKKFSLSLDHVFCKA